jgi:hypothetical protein
VAVLVALVISRRHFAVEVMLLADIGLISVEVPGSILEWFTLLQENP